MVVEGFCIAKMKWYDCLRKRQIGGWEKFILTYCTFPIKLNITTLRKCSAERFGLYLCYEILAVCWHLAVNFAKLQTRLRDKNDSIIFLTVWQTYICPRANLSDEYF